MPYTVRPRDEEIRRARDIAGYWTDQSLARAMGVHYTTVGQVLRHGRPLSARFIAGLLTAFPSYSFEDLFRVEAVGEANGGNDLRDAA